MCSACVFLDQVGVFFCVTSVTFSHDERCWCWMFQRAVGGENFRGMLACGVLNAATGTNSQLTT